jgi:hypothetical protein
VGVNGQTCVVGIMPYSDWHAPRCTAALHPFALPCRGLLSLLLIP